MPVCRVVHRRTRLLRERAERPQKYNTRDHGITTLRQVISSEEKVRLEARVSKDIWLRFMDYIDRIRRSCGMKSSYGLISFVVEEALREYLAAHEDTSPTLAAVLMRDAKICEDIITRLKELKPELQIGSSAGFGLLAKAISDVRGHDKRTIKKWIRRMEELGYINPHPTYPSTWIILWVPR